MIRSSDGPRARYRQQVRDEVQARAWEQITEAGASALSLKAIATRMGMTAPALYRYYRSRDDLLTQLILDTYRELAELIEKAANDPDPPTRLTTIAAALREWSVANPQRYLLVWGTPVPGYSAPAEATDLARRIFAPIVAGCAALHGDSAHQQAGSPAFARAILLWTRLHGILSLEVAGHFTTMDVDTEQLYRDEVERLVAAP